MKITNPKGIIPWFLIIAIPVSILSCYPGGPSNAEDMDLVGTSHDKEFNFSAVSSFSLPDTIVHMVADGEEDELGRDYDSLIIGRVRDQMISHGYNEEPLDTLNPADIVLLISAMSSTNSGVFFDPSWWWGYWGWWPGWGGYPGGPVWGPGWGMGFPVGFPVYLNYTTGTLFITMVDPENTDIDEKTIAVTWLAAINSLLQGGGQYTEQRITDNIDQAFKQSPYLNNNQ
ncbi:MAG: hypothetical protein AMS26_02215 [Bacteroides sp. SM23_62]|nr:MAG: hypothetical protein AMS26_02215 [Bacteroides sp. SM23_62]